MSTLNLLVGFRRWRRTIVIKLVKEVDSIGTTPPAVAYYI
jgi:hypothetical protein